MALPLSSLERETADLQPDNKDVGNTMPPSKSEKAVKPDQQLASRPAPLTWFLVCVGLYLGALLYGKQFGTLSARHSC